MEMCQFTPSTQYASHENYSSFFKKKKLTKTIIFLFATAKKLDRTCTFQYIYIYSKSITDSVSITKKKYLTNHMLKFTPDTFTRAKRGKRLKIYYGIKQIFMYLIEFGSFLQR
jgi:hypothetical protein